MSAPDEPSAAQPLDPGTVKRLAFIRLLYLQGVEQARRTEPLSLASLLTFHDSVELFLVLASDHLGAPLPRRDPNFLDYWQILRRTETFPAGVALSGQPGMDRLNRHRNSLKHAGAFPSREAVEDAHSSVRRFLEDNTPKVFGIEFGDIGLVDVIPQPAIRNKLRAADAAEAAGNRAEAMGLLGSVFTGEFDPPGRRGVPFRFGRTVDPWLLGQEDTDEEPDEEESDGEEPDEEQSDPAKVEETKPRDLGTLEARLGQVTEAVEQVTDAVGQMQKAMRVIALGIDYGRFLRFEVLTDVDLFHNATREEYNFCMQFVIDAAFRLADVEANAVPPSWWDW
jgi:hypothetical protein